jgi:hypothetical protein
VILHRPTAARRDPRRPAEAEPTERAEAEPREPREARLSEASLRGVLEVGADFVPGEFKKLAGVWRISGRGWQ